LHGGKGIEVRDMAKFGILFDSTRCTGCKACQVACKRWNELRGEETELGESFTNPTDLSAHTWIRMNFVETVHSSDVSWHFQRISCMHCEEPPCARNCPTRAITKYSEGPVVVDQSICIGCRYCVQTCPFDIMRFDAERGVVYKCTMCADRIAAGAMPACVDACPMDALEFGDREEMLSKALSKAASVGGYVYGHREAGGTSVFYVTEVAPESLGLPKVPAETIGQRVGGLITDTASIGAAGAVGLAVVGLLSARQRRMKKTRRGMGGEQ